MSEHEQKPEQKNDPWANLAESLGAKPAATPAAERVSRPAASAPPTPARPPQKPREDRPAAAVRSDWGGLASSLGVEPTAESAPPQTSRPQPPVPQPPASPAPRATDEPQPRRSEREQDEFSFGFGRRRPPAEPVQQQSRPPAGSSRRDGGDRDGGEEASRQRPIVDRPEADSRDRTEPGAAPRADREDEQGEGRGRRRRGRRGGRGRGRREDGREEGRDRPLPGRADDEPSTSRRPIAARDHDGFGEPRDERLEEPAARAGQPLADGGDDDDRNRQEPAGESDRDADGAPRRRRRRGRRGGRRRGRGDRDGDVGTRPQADRESGEPALDASDSSPRFADHDSDDEPLPAGYGMRPPARPGADSGRPDASRHDGGEPSGTARSDDRESGESGGRRRRRRRRGEGRSRDARGTTAPAEGSREGSPSRRSSEGRSSEEGGRRGRRGRRTTGDERRSASTFDRGRRDEFAPVAGGREEDDEGLEFLGIEDAGHDGRGRDERHPADDDDSIIESGLNEVLDVPSWVEAIGIVIAGNLDARSRSPRGGDGGGRGGEPRSDSPPRGGSSDRPRDSRRGGRSGNQR
jgi:hypothetical protein